MTNETYDKYGNRLTCINNTIFLHLASGSKKTIGTISNEGKTFRCYRKCVTHTFNTTQSIGFNFRLIEKGLFEFVEVELSGGTVLQTTRDKIKSDGDVKMFKNQGFELQVFLSMNEFSTIRKDGVI